MYLSVIYFFFNSVKQDGLSKYRESNIFLASAVYFWFHNDHWKNRVSLCLAEVACKVYSLIQEKISNSAFSKDLNIKEPSIKLLLTSTMNLLP